MILVMLGLLIAAYPTYTFVRGLVIGSLHPLEQFDSGETLEFTDSDPYSGYLLSMEVDERNAAIPPMEIDLRTSDGTPPETSPIDRWNSIMGREYKQFLVIEPPTDGRLTIRIDTVDSEDFLIYRRIDDVFERSIRRSMPLWITAALPLLGGGILLGVVLVRLVNTSSRVELRIE